MCALLPLPNNDMEEKRILVDVFFRPVVYPEAGTFL